MSLTAIVLEKESDYTHHDQLFKDLIHIFFKEFLEVFFPEVHHHIDFSSIKPLSEEVFTDLFEGESRKADIVIETTLKGKDTVIIIHIEPQSYGQPDFHERMYLYYSLLYNKYRKPILPITVFSYDENRMEQNEFTIDFPFFHVLTFNFLMLELKKKNWRDYIQSNNPVAAALISKMGYSDDERIQVKREFLRMITTMELDPAKMRYIVGFFEKYLILNQHEEEILMKEIKQFNESREIPHLPISWEERGVEKGIDQGKREVALEMLKAGTSIDFIAKVTQLSIESIEEISKAI